MTETPPLSPKENPTKAGFVSIIGLPNAGKSTFLNAAVGSKISITSRKVQTTRMRICGILPHKNSQIIFVDTPGLFQAKKTFDKAMVDAALEGMTDSDIVLHIVDAAQSGALEKNAYIFEHLPENKNCSLVLNKVDKMDKTKLLELTKAFTERFPYQEIFMISALKKNGLTPLLDYLDSTLPDGPWLFPEDQITDIPMRMLAAEITREKIFDRLHQELPYAIFVETTQWENFDNGSIKIDQTVYVERQNQKGIVLGKGGQTLKDIGQAARRDLEDMLETKVHLKLFVKVQQNWSRNSENYRMLGLQIPQ